MFQISLAGTCYAQDRSTLCYKGDQDIVFVVDSSGSIRDDVSLVLSLIVNMLAVDQHYSVLEWARPTKGHLSHDQGLQSHLDPLLRRSVELGNCLKLYGFGLSPHSFTEPAIETSNLFSSFYSTMAIPRRGKKMKGDELCFKKRLRKSYVESPAQMASPVIPLTHYRKWSPVYCSTSLPGHSGVYLGYRDWC